MSRKVFADGTKSRPLALHSSAISASYPSLDADMVAEVKNGIAVICIDGPLEHMSCGWWFDSYENIACRFRNALDDSEVKAVVLKLNSPGGDVAGLFETVKIMTAAKQSSGKRVTAYVDEDCYSAAYALSMVADEIIVPPSGNVGSIGVITTMCEMTKADEKDGFRFEVISSGDQKADGHPHVELTKSAVARTQKKVDELATMFFDLVGSVRGLSADAVKSLQAGSFTGEAAVTAKLADAVMGLEECLTLIQSEFTTTKSVVASATKGPKTMTILAATKALNDAKKALAASTDPEERKTLQAAVVQAEMKYKHVKKTVETIESEDEPEPEEGDDEEGSSASEDEEASAAAPETDILALVSKLTGKSSKEEVVGALHALARTNAHNKKLEAEIASLRADSQRRDIVALVQFGMKSGKIAPCQRAWALSQSAKTIKAYLDATPKMVHVISDEPLVEKEVSGKFGSVTPEMAKMWSKQGFKPADFPGLLAKMNGASGTNGAS